MHLTKHHGLGNDFLVTFVDEIPTDAPATAMELCDRHRGIGADGLVFGIDDGSRPIMRLFNSDGSQAEVSGNGLRCFVQALALRRNVTRIETDVDTPSGLRACALEPTDDPAESFASADMGRVGDGDRPDHEGFLDSIPGLGPVAWWSTADVGNPHVVIEVDDPGKIELATVGPAVESHFPAGVNVHFVRVSGTDEIELAVWERGAGITQACGSGATVAAQRLSDRGSVGERARVRMPGGVVTVDVATADRSSAVLSGTVTYVGAIQVPHG